MQKRMQSTTDIPINEIGISQAIQLRDKMKQIHFDAVYASPFIRTIATASIIADVNASEIIKDARLSEVDFGKYELKRFRSLGLSMTLYWLYPEIFPAPRTVESLQHVRSRVSSFISDLRFRNDKTILICSHGNLIRVLNSELGGRSEKITWKSFPQNCELKTFFMPNLQKTDLSSNSG